MPIIIGLCGKAGSGKGEVAKIISKKVPSIIIPFAKALKEMAKSFGWDGQKDEKGRKFLQLLGTNIGRAYNPNYWVDLWKKEASNALEARVPPKYPESEWGSPASPRRYTIIIADDVRFDNEAEAIHSLGGSIVKIEGRQYDLGDNATHASEQGISPGLIDWHIDNNGSLEHLQKVSIELVTHLLAVKYAIRNKEKTNDN